MTAQALAERFEVSKRTIYRDIDELSAAGVPVHADRGVGGGIALAGGFYTDLTGLTPGEAAAFSLSGLPELASQLGVAADAARAQAKLHVALGERAASLAGRFHLDPADWYERVVMPEHLRTVACAVLERRSLDIEYESWSGVSRRVLDPLGLVVKSGDWYMLARKSNRVGIYRLDKIGFATITEQRFRAPAGFDLAVAWRAAVARFEKQLFAQSAEIAVYPEALARLSRLGAPVREAVLATPADADGVRRVKAPIENDEMFARDLLAFGDGIEIISPPSLRQRMIAHINDLKRRYVLEK